MKILAKDLDCPIYTVAQALEAHGDDQLLFVILPDQESGDGLGLRYPDNRPYSRLCHICQNPSAELAPCFTSCHTAALSKANFLCGRYCWQCLVDAITAATNSSNRADECCYCPSCSEPLPVWAVQYSFPTDVDLAKRWALFEVKHRLTLFSQERYFRIHAAQGGHLCECGALVRSDEECTACMITLSINSPTKSSLSPVALSEWTNSTKSRTVHPSHETPPAGSGGNYFAGSSRSSSTSPNNIPENPSRGSPGGGGQREGPNQPSANLLPFGKPTKQPGGRFIGTATLSDQYGWRQKISISYDLLICPDDESGGETTSHIYTNSVTDKVEVRVTNATFKDQVYQKTMFHIRQMQICVEPTIADSNPPKPVDYRDRWVTSNPSPSQMDLLMLSGTEGRERSLTAQFHFATIPSANVEISQKSSSSRNTHPLTSVINPHTSCIADETPYGGLSWEYNIRKDVDLAYLQLQPHSGQYLTPRSNLPTAMEAKVATLFDITNSKRSGFPNFQNRSTSRGMSIGYCQCKMELKVVVPWAEDKVTRFPDPEKPSRTHQLYIAHEFRGGCENTIKPEKAIWGDVSTELAVAGTR